MGYLAKRILQSYASYILPALYIMFCTVRLHIKMDLTYPYFRQFIRFAFSFMFEDELGMSNIKH